MGDFKFTTVADALDGVIDGTATASKAVVLDANGKIDGIVLTDAKIDDTDTGVIITSVDQTHASPVVTIPDIIDAADTFVVADAAQTLTNKTLTSPKINEDVALTATATQLNEAGSKASSACRLYNLGAPALASVNSLVTSTNMIVGEYTIDGSQPDVPRNVTVSATAGDTADTMGTITFVGTNYADEAITEEITPIAGSTVAGTKAFKTITTITGAGWVIDGSESTNDTVIIGVGNEIGLPIALDSATEIMMGILGTAIVATNPTVGTPATIEETTIDVSSGIYDGTKEILVFVVD